MLCNLVGGNDELVFDGNSLVFNGAGELIAKGKSFEEDFVIVDTETAKPRQSRRSRTKKTFTTRSSLACAIIFKSAASNPPCLA